MELSYRNVGNSEYYSLLDTCRVWGAQSSEKAPVPEHAGFVRLVVADNMQGDDAGVADGRGTLVPEYTLGVEGGVGGSEAKVCVHLPGVSSSRELEVELARGQHLEVRCLNR